MVRRIPPLLSPRAVPFSSFLPRNPLRVSATPWRSNLSPLCFHTLTNPFSRNPFLFTSMPTLGGGVGVKISEALNLSLCMRCFRGKSIPFKHLPPLLPLFVLFRALSPFVFISLQPLFQKHPGGGGWIPLADSWESTTSSLSSVTGSLGGVRWAKRRGYCDGQNVCRDRADMLGFVLQEPARAAQVPALLTSSRSRSAGVPHGE